MMVALAALAVFSGTGCVTEGEPEASAALTDTLNQAQRIAFRGGRDLWNSTKPDSYSFQLSRNCFCFPYGWMEVYVDEGKVVKVDTVAGVEGPYDFESFDNAPDMEDIFDQVEGYLNNPEYEVIAEYDAKMGYPLSVLIHHLPGYHDADAEFRIASFRPQQ